MLNLKGTVASRSSNLERLEILTFAPSPKPCRSRLPVRMTRHRAAYAQGLVPLVHCQSATTQELVICIIPSFAERYLSTALFAGLSAAATMPPANR